MHSSPDGKDKAKGEEIVTAREASTGKLVWEHKSQVSRLPKQESFSGDPIRPQATPALLDGKLCTLGYTGLIHCFDASTGKVLWKYDLVKDHGAKPVQFGFSASPLFSEKSFIVHVGGGSSLMRFDATTGKVMWKAEAGEPSYASPIVAEFFGGQQIIQSTRDHILGIHPATGGTLWKYAMPEAGLTNVPTSLPLPGNQLLVSGQGIKGTRLLQLSQENGSTQFKELWHNPKTPFFYCNFHVVDGMVVGNSNKLLVGLDLIDGKELFRERGYTDSNQLRLGKPFLILGGDGQLHLASIAKTGVTKQLSQSISKDRCWTAPTLVGNMLYLRDQQSIFAVELVP
jgi:outer membrane protein assembly factor BamB